jgi:hypothetical protein
MIRYVVPDMAWQDTALRENGDSREVCQLTFDAKFAMHSTHRDLEISDQL